MFNTYKLYVMDDEIIRIEGEIRKITENKGELEEVYGSELLAELIFRWKKILRRMNAFKSEK
jgi:hypothetical protein